MIDFIIKFIRSIILLFAFCMFGVGAILIRYIVFPIQNIFIKKSQNKRHKFLETLQKSWIFIIWYLKFFKIIKVEIKELDKLKNIKNKIIVSTHPSFLDIVVLMSIIPHSTCFVAEKLAKNPFFKGMVDLLFVLKTQDSDKWVNNACQILNDDINMIIFPMGSRHKSNQKPKIRRGTALLALKSFKDIVIINTDTNCDFLQKNQPVYQAGLKPVKFTVSYIKEINAEEFIRKYPDEVTFKTQLTKEIQDNIYCQK